MKNLIFTVLIILSIILFNSNDYQVENYVPNEETAIKVAEAIWLPIYGNRVLEKKPYRAILSEDGHIWTVKGTIPQGMVGGFPIIEIRKSDCKILRVSHSK